MNGSIKRERQLAAPWREETAQALGRGRAFASRSSAALSRRSRARIDSGGTPPLRSAKRQPRHWAADVYYPLDEARPSAAGLACRLGRSWAVPTGDQDPVARIDSGGTPPRFAQSEHGRLEIRKMTS